MAAQPYLIEGYALLAVVMAAACGPGAAPAGRLEASFTNPPHDTTRFTAGARAATCAHGKGLLLEGFSGGNGVLAWLRGGGPTPDGTYGPLPRGDSVTPRGAVVAARLAPHDPSRGVLLDSGTVTISSKGGRISARIQGRGMDLSTASRVTVDATFEGVPAPSDTVECRVEP